MANQQTFTINVQDPVRTRVAQARAEDAWEDIELPLAEVVDQLQAQVSNLEGQTTLIAGAVRSFATELPQSAQANIVESISNRISFSENNIQIQARRTDVIEADLPTRATVRAVDTLSTELTEAEALITANQASITTLTTSVGTKAETTTVTALTDRVTVNEGNITTAQSDITTLTSSVGTKAEAAALTALTNRVTTNETDITTNQASINSLESTVDDKAETSALTTLSNRVTVNETTIAAEQTKLTNLTTTVGTKADATALTTLSNRVTANEEDITTNQSSITSLTAAVNARATLTALNALSQTVTVNTNAISAEQTKLTALTTVVAGKAETNAVTALSGRVDVTETDISAINSEITSLESRIVGTNLGPETNAFTGMNRAAAETARDRYFTNNAAKLAQYDADSTINIRLTWGVLRVYQFRRNNAWVDNGEVEPTATAVTSLNTSVIQNTSDISDNEANITANAEAITMLTSTVGDIDVSAIETLETKVTNIENVDGSTTLSGLARWLVKTQVDDLVGGVGLYNDGSSVDFIINANRFAVVPPGWEGANSEKRIPFAVITDHRYVMTWNAFAGATSYQYRTSNSDTSWGPWLNAPGSRRVVVNTTEDRRFQIRSIPQNRLSNIETFISGDTDSPAPVFPAPAITVALTSMSRTYIDVAAIREASILGAKIADATITNAHIANATISGAKIGAAEIGSAHIVDASILTAKIGLAQINNAHIIDATINFAKIDKGDIFDLTIGNEIKSSNFQETGTRTIPAVAAEATVLGLTFTATSPGTGGNNQSVKFTARRVGSVSGIGVVVSGDATNLVIDLQDDSSSDTVFFDRDDIADAVNAYSSRGVTAAGAGSLAVDFTGLVAEETERQVIDLSAGSYAEGASTSRPGTRFKQWNPSPISLDDGKFSTGSSRLNVIILYSDDWMRVDFTADMSDEFVNSGLLTLIIDSGESFTIELSDLTYSTGNDQFTGRPSNREDIEDVYDALSTSSEEATLILEVTNVDDATKDVATTDLSGGEQSRTITGGAGWRIRKDANVVFNEGSFRGSVDIGVDISSKEFTAGSTGWIIRQDGTAEFDAASIRGTLRADHIDADVLNWRRVFTGRIRNNVSNRFLDITGIDPSWRTADSLAVTISEVRNSSEDVYNTMIVPLEILGTANFTGYQWGGNAGQQMVFLLREKPTNRNILQFAPKFGSIDITLYRVWRIQEPS